MVLPREIRISRSRLIGATLDQVWGTLAALDQISRWARNIDHSSYTTQATAGLGAARRVQVGRIALLETITEWVPPTRLAYALVGLPPVVGRVTNTWQLGPATGGTQATLTTRIDPGRSIVGRIGAAVLSRVLARTSEQLLAGLARHHADHGRSPRHA